MKTMTPRQSKVANEVHHICAAALLQGRVATTLNISRMTVVDCWVSPDLRLARLYVQLPAGTEQQAFLAEVNAQLPKGLRKVLAGQLATKYIPEVTFFPAEEEF
jgi:ribosome-binding factor A